MAAQIHQLRLIRNPNISISHQNGIILNMPFHFLNCVPVEDVGNFSIRTLGDDPDKCSMSLLFVLPLPYLITKYPMLLGWYRNSSPAVLCPELLLVYVATALLMVNLSW